MNIKTTKETVRNFICSPELSRGDSYKATTKITKLKNKLDSRHWSIYVQCLITTCEAGSCENKCKKASTHFEEKRRSRGTFLFRGIRQSETIRVTICLRCCRKRKTNHQSLVCLIYLISANLQQWTVNSGQSMHWADSVCARVRESVSWQVERPRVDILGPGFQISSFISK